jgi:hypothetical protein
VTEEALNETLGPEGVEVEETAIDPAKLFAGVLPRLLIETASAGEVPVVGVMVELRLSENPVTRKATVAEL